MTRERLFYDTFYCCNFNLFSFPREDKIKSKQVSIKGAFGPIIDEFDSRNVVNEKSFIKISISL